tara:strand:+ start:2117 stop:2542 length:426 start_codon:yes stop_codon:yes gene_type:complete
MSKVPFQISQVSVDQFATFPLPITESKQVNFDMNMSLSINDEKRVVYCSFNVTMKLEGETIITILVTCGYSIESKSWEAFASQSKTNNDVPIPFKFMKDIADQTLATVRGVLYAKTENTKYSTFLIPIFDLKDLFKNLHSN